MFQLSAPSSSSSPLRGFLRGTTALVALFLLDGTQAHAGQVATQITPDGRTQTNVAAGPQATTITTGTISGGDAFNSFKNFTVGTGATVNLIVPGQAHTLINVVRDSAIDVDGTLNSFKNGRIGGNVYFADPYGMIVGPQGSINTGALTVTTPTSDFLDKVVDMFGKVDAATVAALKAGDEPISKDGLISIKGHINVQNSVKLRGYQVASTGTIEAKMVSKKMFDASVNTDGLKEGSELVEGKDGIEIVAAEDAQIGGTLSADGAAGRNAGSVSVKAGHDIAVADNTTITASGHGANSGGGKIALKAANNLVTGNGVQLSTHAGTTGDAGTIELSAVNTVQVGQVSYDLSATGGKAGSVLIDPALLEITANQTTNGGAFCVGDECAPGGTVDTNSYTTIKLDQGVTVSTVGAANAASGAISLTAQNIDIEGILNAGASAGGTAGDVTLTATQSQTPATSIDAAGSSDTITVGSAAQITGGAVSLAANSTMQSGAGTADATATITVSGHITGSSVSIVANSDAETTGLANLTSLTGAAANAITAELGLNAETAGLPLPLDGIGYMHAGANATVNLLSGANVTATDGNGSGVTIEALATEATSISNTQPSIGLATTVSEIDGTADTAIGSGASIGSQSNIEIASHNLAIGLASAATSSSGSPVALTVAINEATVNTSATVSAGSTIDAPGQVSVIARNDDAFITTAAAQAGGSSGVGSGAIGLAFITTNATARMSASIGQDGTVPTTLLVEADTIGVSDTIDASSTTGGDPDKSSPTGNQETGDYIEDDYLNKYLGKIFSDAGNLAQISGVVAYNDVTHDTTAIIDAAQITASQAVSVLATSWDGGLETNANSSNSANSSTVDSKDKGTPAKPTDATASAGDASKPDEQTGGGTGFAVDAAVAITDLTNNTSALIAPNVTITAPDIAVASNFTLPVDNGILTDEQAGIAAVTDATTVIHDVPGSLSLSGAEQTATDGWTVKTDLATLKGIYDNFSGQIGISNGFATASGSSDKAGVYGSVDYVQLDNNTVAWVGSGAHLNSTGGSPAWTVAVDGGDTSLDVFQSDAYQATYGSFDPASANGSATFAIPMAVTVAANSSTIFIDSILSQPAGGKVAVGGSADIVMPGGDTVAGIDAGASVNSTSGVGVQATTTDLGLIVTASSGSGAGVGITGDVSFLDLSNTTHAVISNEATVSAPTIDVTAAQNIEVFNIAGDLTQSSQAAIGASVAIGLAGTDTSAYIGDDTADLAIAKNLVSEAARIGSFGVGEIDANTLSVTATTSGTVGSLAVAGAVQKGVSDTPPAADSPDSGGSSGGDSGSFLSGLTSKISDISGPVQDLLSGNADGILADLSDKATADDAKDDSSSDPAPTTATDADTKPNTTAETSGATGLDHAVLRPRRLRQRHGRARQLGHGRLAAERRGIAICFVRRRHRGGRDARHLPLLPLGQRRPFASRHASLVGQCRDCRRGGL